MASIPEQKINVAPLPNFTQVKDVDSLVMTLLERYLKLWWSSSRDFPEFHVTHTVQEQSASEKQL